MIWTVAIGLVLAAWLLFVRSSARSRRRDLQELGGERSHGLLVYLCGHRLLRGWGTPAFCGVYVCQRGLLLRQGWQRVRLPFDDVVDMSIEPAGYDLLLPERRGQVSWRARAVMGKHPHLRVGFQETPDSVGIARFAIFTPDGERTADAAMAAWRDYREHANGGPAL